MMLLYDTLFSLFNLLMLTLLYITLKSLTVTLAFYFYLVMYIVMMAFMIDLNVRRLIHRCKFMRQTQKAEKKAIQKAASKKPFIHEEDFEYEGDREEEFKRQEQERDSKIRLVKSGKRYSVVRFVFWSLSVVTGMFFFITLLAVSSNVDTTTMVYKQERSKKLMDYYLIILAFILIGFYQLFLSFHLKLSDLSYPSKMRLGPLRSSNILDDQDIQAYMDTRTMFLSKKEESEGIRKRQTGKAGEVKSVLV